MNFKQKRIRNDSNQRLTLLPSAIFATKITKKSVSRKTHSFINIQYSQNQTCEASKPNWHKSKNPLFLETFKSIFNENPLKQSAFSTSKALIDSIRIKNSQFKRQRSRVESLDNLLQQCNDIQEESKTARCSLSGQQTVKNSIQRLEKSIDKCQEKFDDSIINKRSENSLREDAKIMKQQLGIVIEKYSKSKKKIWKFSTPAITKRTEKLLASVENGFKSRKHLQ